MFFSIFEPPRLRGFNLLKRSELYQNKRTRLDPFILIRETDSNLEYIRTTLRP